MDDNNEKQNTCLEASDEVCPYCKTPIGVRGDILAGLELIKYNDEYVLLVKFAEPNTDYIVDDVIYFNGETFIQSDHNMID